MVNVNAGNENFPRKSETCFCGLYNPIPLRKIIFHYLHFALTSVTFYTLLLEMCYIKLEIILEILLFLLQLTINSPSPILNTIVLH